MSELIMKFCCVCGRELEKPLRFAPDDPFCARQRSVPNVIRIGRPRNRPPTTPNC